MDYSKPVQTEAAGTPYAGVDFGQDQEGYARGKLPWLEQIKAHPPTPLF